MTPSPKATRNRRRYTRLKQRCQCRKAQPWMRRGERHLLIGDIDPKDQFNDKIVPGIYFCDMDSEQVGPGKWRFIERQRDNFFLSWIEGGQRQRMYFDTYEEARAMQIQRRRRR